jgi:hypothetical protein
VILARFQAVVVIADSLSNFSTLHVSLASPPATAGVVSILFEPASFEAGSSLLALNAGLAWPRIGVRR